MDLSILPITYEKRLGIGMFEVPDGETKKQHVEVPYRCFGAFRFLLALSVVFAHSTWLIFAEQTSQQVMKFGLGSIAVMGFFVLSGYIIAEAVTTFYRGRPFFFILNRFLRVAPPYFGALLLSWGIHFYLDQRGLLQRGLAFEGMEELPPDIFSGGTLAYNVMAIFPLGASAFARFMESMGVPFSTYMFFRYMWALNFEVIFYCIVFLTVWLFCWAKGHERAVMAIVVGMVLYKYVMAVCVLNVVSVWRFAPFFLAGVGLYNWEKIGFRARSLVITSALGLIFLQDSHQRLDSIPLSAEWFRHIGNWDVILHAFLVIGLVLCVRPLSQMCLRVNVKQVDKWLGDVSYPIYLNHFSVLLLVSAFWGGSEQRGIIYWLAALSAVCIVSWMMNIMIEMPMKGLRDHIRGETLQITS